MWYIFWSFQSSDGNHDKPADGVPVSAGTTGSPRCAAAIQGIIIDMIESDVKWEIWIEIIENAETWER